MSDHLYYCAFPAYCATGKHIVNVNHMAPPFVCPDGHVGDVVPYSDARLSGSPGEHRISNWKDLSLHDGTYLCPQCGQMSLRFGITASGQLSQSIDFD